MASNESSPPSNRGSGPIILSPKRGALAERDIAVAADAIRAGGLVAFPTDTVYGVAANAGDPDAVGRLYEAKQRPREKALPVLVADRGDVHLCARDVSRAALDLMEQFWPGPLTIVLKRTDAICPEAVNGGDTVALRMPDSDVARAILRAAGLPVVVTSANPSGGPETVESAEVARSLGSWLDVIVESDTPASGRPSTLIDMTTTPPRVLREGPVSREQLAEVVGELA